MKWFNFTVPQRDSRPYQQTVKQAAQAAGLQDYQVVAVMDMAAHVDPAVIEGMYGKAVAQACANLQAYNAKR